MRQAKLIDEEKDANILATDDTPLPDHPSSDNDEDESDTDFADTDSDTEYEDNLEDSDDLEDYDDPVSPKLSKRHTSRNGDAAGGETEEEEGQSEDESEADSDEAPPARKQKCVFLSTQQFCFC